MIWKIIVAIVLASFGSYFVPTPIELQNKFKSAQNFFAVKDYKKAIKQYDDIINTNSDFLTSDSVKVELLNKEFIVGVKTASYYQRANSYKNLKEFDKAFDDFRTVSEKREDSPALSALAQYQIYDLYYSNLQYPQAISNAKIFVEKFSKHEKVDRTLYDIGWAFRETKKYDSSNIYFRTVVSKFDSSSYIPKALYQMGQNYFDQKQWDNARKVFDELVTKFNPSSFNKKEFENIELRSVKERKVFEASANRDNDESTLQLVAKSEVKIGDCYDKLDNYEKAMAAYNKVTSTYLLIPSLMEMTYIRMAELAIRLKSLEDGIYIYRQAIDNNFQNKELQAKLQFKIAQTYQEKKQYQKSADEYNFYAKGYPATADKINFPAENARYMAIGMFFNGKINDKVIINVDTFLVRHPNSDYIPDALFLKALALKELKRYDESRSVLSFIIQNYKKSNQYSGSRMQFARSYFEQKNYSEAKNQFQKLYSEDSNKVDKNELFYYLGLSDYFTENYSEAISHLSQVGTTSQFYPLSIGRISKSYISLKRQDEGLSYLNDLMKKSVNDSSGILPTLHFALGDVFTALEKYDSSLYHFNSVVEDSNNTTENIKLQALYARGALLFQMAKYDNAVKDFDYCLKNQTFNKTMINLIPSVNEKYAFSLVELGRNDEAVKKLIEPLNSNIDEFDKIRYRSSLSEVYFRIKDYDQSIKISEELIKKDSLDDNIKLKAYVTTANCLGAMGNIEKAKTILTEVSAKFPNSPYVQDVMYQFAMLHFSNQDFKNAVDLLTNYVGKYPKSNLLPQAIFYRGAALFKMTKFEESSKAFQRFYQSYPNHKMAPEATFQFAECMFNLQKFDEATKAYQLVYKKTPKCEFAANAMMNEGWAYFQQQKLESMIETFKNMLSKYKDSPMAGDAAFSIGDYYYNKKDYDNATKFYEKLIKEFPTHQRVEEAKGLVHEIAQINSYLDYEKAIVLFDNRDYPKAIQELTKVIEKYPDADIIIGSKLNMASAYEQLGNDKKAIEIFEELLQKTENDPMQTNAALFARQHVQYLKSRSEKKDK